MNNNYENTKNSKYNKLEIKIATIEIKLNKLIDNIKQIEEYNNIQDSIQDIIMNVNDIQDKFHEIDKINSNINDLSSEINNIYNASSNYYKEITDIYNNTKTQYGNSIENLKILNEQNKQKINTITTNINDSEDILTEIKDLNNESLKFNENINKINSNAISLQNKIIQIHKDSVDYRNKILDLYDEIYGYEYDDEDTGKLVQEEGLKQKLEDSYKQLQQESEKLSGTINTTIEQITQDTNGYIKTYIDEQEAKYNNIYQKIQNLLPSALTAGLASAYGEKRKNEEETLKNSNTKFLYSIFAAIIVALIPIIISFDILKTTSLEETISYIPKLMTFLIPVYVPVIWLAAHFNKQIKLSKRLIEEYTHKEVLNKTFEGLAKQIDQLDLSNENYNELRAKLLYNIIEMTSHNPGQLIKGFEHTDHPLIEVLNKITQSEESLSKLQNIPGISIIIDRLQSRIDKNKENINKEISDLYEGNKKDIR